MDLKRLNKYFSQNNVAYNRMRLAIKVFIVITVFFSAFFILFNPAGIVYGTGFAVITLILALISKALWVSHDEVFIYLDGYTKNEITLTKEALLKDELTVYNGKAFASKNKKLLCTVQYLYGEGSQYRIKKDVYIAKSAQINGLAVYDDVFEARCKTIDFTTDTKEEYYVKSKFCDLQNITIEKDHINVLDGVIERSRLNFTYNGKGYSMFVPDDYNTSEFFGYWMGLDENMKNSSHINLK